MCLWLELIVINKLDSAVLGDNICLATWEEAEQVLGYTIKASNFVSLIREELEWNAQRIAEGLFALLSITANSYNLSTELLQGRVIVGESFGLTSASWSSVLGIEEDNVWLATE